MEINYRAQKAQEAKGRVHAGKKSNLLSKRGRRRMPTTKGYSEASKVYSPASRGI